MLHVKSQALVTTKLIRKPLQSLRVRALCNLAAFTQPFSSLQLHSGGHPASLIVQLRVLPTKKSCTATNAAQRSNVHSMRGAGAAALTQPSRPRDSESIAPPNHRSRISRRASNKWRTHAGMKPPALGKLAATGAVLGPACDAIHNQSLLQYDVLPIGDGIAKTSLLIPPLLALTYALLCLLYTSPSPRDYAASRMPSSA